MTENLDQLPTVAGPQAELAVTSREPPAAAPPILDGNQRALLAAVLDRIVPANGALAGAGALGVGDGIERTLAVSPRLRRLLIDGLVVLQVASGRTGACEFAELAPDAQDDVLRAVQAAEPAFFIALVEHAYRGYYLLPDVRRAIGFIDRSPQPLGHQLPPFDPALLDVQRTRAPFWRRTQ